MENKIYGMFIKSGFGKNTVIEGCEIKKELCIGQKELNELVKNGMLDKLNVKGAWYRLPRK